jgi:sarcosine oxidase subunit alpha
MPRLEGKSLGVEEISITINGRPIRIAAGTSVAAAVMMADEPCRFSVSGEARAPLCGMGICMECRVTVNGVPHQRSCMLLCAPGMEVVSG